MPDDKRMIKVSKYLSKHLRHEPERLGLVLEPGGWVRVDTLLAACAAQNFAITEQELRAVVASSDKQRFAFDSSGERIRANQGHSVSVDLGLEPAEPPAVLFHGTGAGSAEAIRREGLKRMGRHHVHLSAERETAVRVGQRHGKPVVFSLDTAAMCAAGHVFYVSENGVWLTDSVPSEFLSGS